MWHRMRLDTRCLGVSVLQKLGLPQAIPSCVGLKRYLFCSNCGREGENFGMPLSSAMLVCTWRTWGRTWEPERCLDTHLGFVRAHRRSGSRWCEAPINHTYLWHPSFLTKFCASQQILFAHRVPRALSSGMGTEPGALNFPPWWVKIDFFALKGSRWGWPWAGWRGARALLWDRQGVSEGPGRAYVGFEVQRATLARNVGYSFPLLLWPGQFRDEFHPQLARFFVNE